MKEQLFVNVKIPVANWWVTFLLLFVSGETIIGEGSDPDITLKQFNGRTYVTKIKSKDDSA